MTWGIPAHGTLLYYRDYFATMLALVTLVSVLNGLILLPLILTVVGPAPVQTTKLEAAGPYSATSSSDKKGNTIIEI